jgi:hypothetical protein
MHVLHLLRFKRTTMELWDAIREDANANGLLYMSIHTGPTWVPHMSIPPKFVMAVLTHWRHVEEGECKPAGLGSRLVCEAATVGRIRAIAERMPSKMQCKLLDRDEQTFTITVNDAAALLQ